MEYPRIAVVILNYNSEKDLLICTEKIAKQINIHLSIILIDNASQPKSVKRIKFWLSTWQPDAICGTQAMVYEYVSKNPEIAEKSGQVYLIENKENKGYSAGNNIGNTLAKKLDADAVLIINPDVRIEDPRYLEKLSVQIFSKPSHYIAASRILDLDGKDQNPLREATFMEEFFWPRQFLRNFLKNITYVLPCNTDKPILVPKVSGCCLMLKMSFLHLINNLDENVFLYCEEPILSAQVFSARGNIVYVPTLSALHAHRKSEKGNAYDLIKLFIISRKYYLKNYSSYSSWQLTLLHFSYAIFALYNLLQHLSNVIFKRTKRLCSRLLLVLL